MNRKRLLGGLWFTIALSGFLFLSWIEVPDIKRLLIILVFAEVLTKAIRILDYFLYGRNGSDMELFLQKEKRNRYSSWAAIGRQTGYLILISLALTGIIYPAIALTGMALISVTMMAITFAVFTVIGE